MLLSSNVFLTFIYSTGGFCARQGTWWYRSIRYSGDQILINTTQLFMHFMYKTPNMNMKRTCLPPRIFRRQ